MQDPINIEMMLSLINNQRISNLNYEIQHKTENLEHPKYDQDRGEEGLTQSCL